MAARDARTLYVGGLEDRVDDKVLQSVFVPFGNVLNVDIPIDQGRQKHRGFGFVTFEEEEDAAAALDNVNQSELYGRVLTVTIARPDTKTAGSKAANFAFIVWENDDYFKKNDPQEEDEEEKEKMEDTTGE